MRKPKLLYTKSYADRYGKRREYRAARRQADSAARREVLDRVYDRLHAGGRGIQGRHKAPDSKIGADRVMPGTLEAAIVSYYRSAKFLNLKPISQKNTRNVLERIRREYGAGPMAKLERRHVEQMMAKLADRPAMANRFLKVLRPIIKHAIVMGMRKDDPTVGVEKLKTRSEGFVVWTEEEVAKFYGRMAWALAPDLPWTCLSIPPHEGRTS